MSNDGGALAGYGQGSGGRDLTAQISHVGVRPFCYVRRQVEELSDTDRREVCPGEHGWVGRRRFQLERHDLCEAPVDAAPELEDGDDEVEAIAEPAPFVDVPPAERRRIRRKSPRQLGVPRKKTIGAKKITRLQLLTERIALRVIGADEVYDRPKTRGDCCNVPRPCPYVGCPHNLYLDVSPSTGSITFNFPNLEPEEMDPESSCSLDLSACGGMTLEGVGTAMNITRERTRQIEVAAMVRKLLPALVAAGIEREDVKALLTRYTTGPGGELADKGADGELPSDVTYLISGG